MYTTRTPRHGVGLLALAALMILTAIHLGGCSNDDISPTDAPLATAPTLPDPETLAFDFDFFDGAAEMEKGGDGRHENFVNAYLRAVVLQAMAELTLAPPVAAFAVALHTVPDPQDDGAWIWSYDWYGYRYPIRVALRGDNLGDHVDWEMRIGPGGVDPTAVWFAGQTSDDGQTGRWTFYDLDDPDQPACGEIAWGDDTDGRFLEFLSLEAGSDGDTLRFADHNPDFAIEFIPGDGSVPSFIRWSADGTGSLRVPDYNDGLEACWDRWQENVDCR